MPRGAVFEECAGAGRAACTRGTVDIDGRQHYVWTTSTGQQFDLLLNAEVSEGQLIVRDGHIMPSTGAWSAAANTMGRSGLNQLVRALKSHFGVQSVNLVNRIPRPSGSIGYFGPGVYGK